MTKSNFLLILSIFFVFSSCAQKNMYDLKDYQEIKRGAESIGGVLWPNVIVLQHKMDTNYIAKFTYEDSLYKELRTVFFYYKGIADGPFKAYVNGRLFIMGSYKNGKRNGERITYGEHSIISREFFKDGIKVGTWEEYDDNGKLVRKTIYDEKGNVKEDKYY